MKSQNSKPIMVYAAGVFDLLHYGHIEYLRWAKAQGDCLVVGIVDDNGTERYKGKKPILNYEERYRTIQALDIADYIVRQCDTDPTGTLNILQSHKMIVDIMIRADDYQDTPPGTEWIEKHGGRVIRSKYCSEISSTDIKNRILEKGLNG